MNHLFLAHNLMFAGGSSSLPVIGTPTSALIFALLFTAAVLILYLVIEHLPLPGKNLITAKNEPTFIKIMIVVVSGAIVSSAWDIWWHQTVGRDSIWIPPHVSLYSFTILGIVLGLYVWRHCRDIIWKHIAFVLMFVLISAPFDNYWHSIFGVENYASPVRLAWAPPHALLEVSVLFALVLLLQALLKFPKTSDFNFFANLAFGAINSMALVLLYPFHPTEGWGQVAGFAGAFTWAAAFIGIALTAQRLLKGRINATFMIIFSLLFMLISYSKDIASAVIMLPHDRPPVWLFMFSFLLAAIFLDVTQDVWPIWLRGLLAGVIWSGILFGFSSYFFSTQFQYGPAEVLLAMYSSALAGLIVGICLNSSKGLKKVVR